VKIDVFAHICPQKFIDAFAKQKVSWEVVGKTALANGGAVLFNVDARLEVMDRYEDYVQVLTPTANAIEPYYDPKDENYLYLVKTFNDAVAEIANKYPDRFVASVAALPLNNIDAAIKEIDRTINEMGFKGILLDTPVFVHDAGRPVEAAYNYDTMKPLDLPEFMPIYETMSKLNLPIWIHPVGQAGVPVYSGEQRGKYVLSHVFGWPMESTMTMGRLICRGVMSKYPNLKFIIHHCGSAIVPALAGRIANEFDKFKAIGVLKFDQPGEEDPFLSKNAADYFRMFYADTALYGDTSGLMCGYDFFGPEHIIFGTDYPYDLVGGDKFIKKTVEAVYRMNVSDADKKKIFEDNARRIMRLDTG